MHQLDRFYLQTSIIVILKAKAKKELEKLPAVESILFDHCSTNSKSTQELATCVHRLIRERQKRDLYMKEIEGTVTTTQTTIIQEQQPLPKDSIKKLTEKPSKLRNKTLENSLESFWIKKSIRKISEKSTTSSINLDSKETTSSTTFSKEQITNESSKNVQQKSLLNIFKLPINKLQIWPLKMTQAIKRRWMLYKLKRRYNRNGVKRLRFESVGDEDVGNDRKKRETIANDSQNSTTRQCIKRMENVENLRHIREYIQTANECLEYLKGIGETNAKQVKTSPAATSQLFFRFLSTNMQLPVTYTNEKLQSSSAITQLEQFVNDLENKELSFLSPKILNVLPAKQNAGPQHLFSPTILSFEDEGLAPLPRILSLISTNQCEIIEWLDLFIHMTGASHQLRQLLQRFGPDMQLFRDQIHPKVEKLRNMSAIWSKFGETMTAEQKEHMERYGYVPMNEKQIEIAYERKENIGEEHAKEFVKQLKEDKDDQLLENLIGELAEKQTSSNRRSKRDLRIAAPSAFTTTIAQASIFQNNILSPSAFSLSLLRPRALGANMVEARAFVASIMAPNMLLARILFPSAFRLILMTPHVLNTYILVPEAFLATILSPRVLSSRILSPDAFTVSVLTPVAGFTQILSPHLFRYQVLSPSILTASFWSKSIFTVEVLSPSFLSINDDFLKNGTVYGTDFVKTFNASAKKGLLG